jgi:SIR2-like protein
VLIEDPLTYKGLDEGREVRPTILKIHGTFDPESPERDSYVISENQYIDYLTTDVWDEIPAVLNRRIRDTHFLFLGYGMRDWNLMVVLKRLGLIPPEYKAWAVQLNQTRFDVQRWNERRIESLDVDLAEYVNALAAKLAELD